MKARNQARRVGMTPAQDLDTPGPLSEPAWGNAAAQQAMVASQGGPVDDTMQAALRACFGPQVDGVDFARGSSQEATALGAEAFNEGSSVNLGGHQPTVDDPHAAELLAHETAHALAGGGTGEELLSRTDDPGERNADRAGQQFRDWIAQGMSGPAPRLSPATGGQAAIHRFESPEHIDAVDGALTRARNSSDPKVQATADKAAGLLDPSKKITLGNGLEVTPGQITALMGDFYGLYDDDGNFDAAASFQQLYNGDAEDMQRLLDLMEQEKDGTEITPDMWEDAMKDRKENPEFTYTDPVTGQQKTYTQLGYLDLATRNENHFSGPNNSGTDNNMGTYAAFHEMALNNAQTQAGLAPEDQNLDMLRAMESCGMHYLTDRHAGGHNFQKSGVMHASGYMESGLGKLDWPLGAVLLDTFTGDGTTANLFVKAIHDDWNKNGVDVGNGAGDADWLAKGDGHWWDEDNAKNRDQTAKSVVTSFAELQSVLDGESTPEQLKQQGHGAFKTAPAWSDDLQQTAEQKSQDATFAGVALGTAAQYVPMYGGKALDAVGGAVHGKVVEPVQQGYDNFINEWARWEEWMSYGNLPRF